ncbi:unnamed protein product [Thlaspi arvense]|uniref:Uncharacterized protein n=1 Tax=Thlaspi arvense TaxID=13288 RepID=A0AAU9RP20_THLAR|nr:unnamed protein product [Thlaspi arvense]
MIVRQRMAPKKKPQKNQTNNKPVASSIPNSSHKKPSKVPKLLISPEDEERLRQLLLNFRRNSSPVRVPIQTAFSEAQKKKKLLNLYEKLSCEGFLNEQIESALSSLRDGAATFETALDWLCLNYPSHELPLNFSTGSSRFPNTGGSVSVISNSRKDCSVISTSGEDCNECYESTAVQEKQEEEPEVLVRVKGKRDEEDTLSSCQSSQADWIREYMRRLEEEEMESSDDKEVPGPRPFEVIAEDYCSERSDAVKAKRKGDKRGQKEAGLAICKPRKKGIPKAMLEPEFLREQSFEDATETEVTSPMPDDAVCIQLLDDLNLGANPVGSCNSEETQPKALPLSSSGQELVMSDDILEDMELGDLFLEDVPPYEPSPHELLELHKKETKRELCDERNIAKLKGIWKKGQVQKIPKAILHQLCQKSGWEAPKFNKVTGEENNISYTISVMCKSSGCGKTREAGGLVTIKLPHQVEDFESIEDAQNRVAAFALHKLFSDLPVHFAITEPYASLVLTWKQKESLGIQSSEEGRRAKFVDSLLQADNFRPNTSSSGIHKAHPMVDSCVKEIDDLNVIKSNHRAKTGFSMEAECSYLKRKQERNKKIQKYKDMLKTRAALPISDVVGCTKTTSVGLRIEDTSLQATNLKKRLWNR